MFPWLQMEMETKRNTMIRMDGSEVACETK
jgi:hypothetical protein